MMLRGRRDGGEGKTDKAQTQNRLLIMTEFTERRAEMKCDARLAVSKDTRSEHTHSAPHRTGRLPAATPPARPGPARRLYRWARSRAAS